MAAKCCPTCNQPLPQPSTTNTRRRLSPTLPEELIDEILLRLPVKSLLKFRSVCKSWKTLISDPQFANTHLRFSTTEDTNMTHQRLVSYCLTDPYKIIAYPMKSLFEKSSTCDKPVTFIFNAKDYEYIIGSCNGLLCMFDRFQHVNMFNPSIRFQSKNSPKANLPWPWKIRHHGFGYDQINDKYKVLIVFQNKNDFSQNLTKIYTFGDDSWKTIQNFQPAKITSMLGKFVSGTLNWIVDKTGIDNTNQRVILSYDLAKEAYVQVLLPKNDGVEEVCKKRILCVLSNCLCVCDTIVSGKSHWVIWSMKEYGVVESWTKLMIIPREIFIWNSVVEPLFFLKNVVLLWNTPSSKFILYNLNRDRFDYPSISSSRLRLNLHVLCESLVSPRW